MKKKLFIFLFVLIIISITGCHSTKQKKKEKNHYKLYEQISLMDKGVNMFQGIVPKGWSYSISSQNIVNSSYPFVETVVLTNKDNSAKITILSQHSYTENNRFNEGENTDYYTTYLHQMNASDYLDYFMNSIFIGATFIKDNEVDSKILEQLSSLHNLRVELGKNDASKLQGQVSGYTIGVNGEGYSSAKKEYQKEDLYYEASTSVSAIGTSLHSELLPSLDSYAIQWYMPYVIIYEVNSKEDYEKYYDDYNFIIANSAFTVDYYAMVEYVSSAIVNAYSSYYTEKSKAGLEAMNNYIDSNYSSTSSESTNDKVMQMWDDVINEVDRYETEDGSIISTSIHNDTVAQRGDEIYVGTKGGIPEGFNELSKVSLLD